MRAQSVLPIALSALVAAASATDSNPRPALSLDGQWEFRLDPKGEGETAKWFEPTVPFPERITVPGNWQAQGFGEPRNHLAHDYQGKAWYRRTVTVPANWSGQRLWVRFDGVTAMGEVYVNGVHAGTVPHFVTPFEFDVTALVQVGGENVLACQVDSQSGCHDPHAGPLVKPGPVGMFNYWGHWGGLYRGVTLEARSDPYIDTLAVAADTRKHTARTTLILRRSASGRAAEYGVLVRVTPVTGGATSTAKGSIRFLDGRLESEPAVLSVRVKDAHPWSPEEPFLYGVEAVLLADGTALDAKCDRFGMREIEAREDGVLLLNGKPYFIRGIGDDCVEPITGTLVPDKAVYAARIALCKKYGYNAFRFLAHTPTRAVFDAADEAGFLILAEAPAYWNTWPRYDEVIPLHKAMVPQIIREHRNHPSWYAWSGGNECAETPQWMDYLTYAHSTFRQMDPSRLFIASEGTSIFPMDIVTLANMFGGAGGAGGISQPFSGLLAEVAYFKRCLAEAEIAKLASPAPGYPKVVTRLHPSGYWRLDPASADELPSQADGSASWDQGQPGPLPAAEPSGSIRFGAGVAAVSLKSVAPATFAAGNQPFSLSLWAKPSGFAKGDYGTPFACGAASSGAAFLLSMDGDEGSGRILIGLWMANVAKSARSLTAGEWNHVGVTYDGQDLRLFINGQPDTVTTVRLKVEPVDGQLGNLVREVTPDRRVETRPHIWHEFPSTYVGSLPDLTVAPKYTGVVRDNHCVALHVQEIADFGLTERYPDLRQRSIDFLHLYLKDVYEGARKSPTLDGYGYWLLSDLPGGVEGDPPCLGLLNMFYEPEKFPDPRPFLRFNRETVILMSAGAGERTLQAGERRPLTLSVAHYGAKPVRHGVLAWQVKSGAAVTSAGRIKGINLAVGQVQQVGTLSLDAGGLDQAAKLTLEVRLVSATCRQENAWDFWAYPARKGGLADRGVANVTGMAEVSARYAADARVAPGATRVVVTDKMDAAVLDYVSGGGTVVLLTEAGALQQPLPTVGFWAEPLRSVGYVVEDHPAVRAFPHDGNFSYPFYRLVGAGMSTLDLTRKGSLGRERFHPIVWSLKADFDTTSGFNWPDPRARTKLFRCGILCEGRIGRGRVLTCSLRVLEGIRHGYPEAGYLLDCLVDYALATPVPNAGLPVLSAEEARTVFRVGSQANVP
jgi:hypothetical protein